MQIAAPLTLLKSALAGVVLAGLTALPAAAAELVRVASQNSVSVTADRLAAAVEGAGAKVFARIDHGAGAGSVGIEVAPSVLLIFGNPKLGSPAIRDAASIGLDLPLRVLVTGEDGAVELVYHAPADMAALHGLPADHPSIVKMTGALGKLTAKAASAE